MGDFEQKEPRLFVVHYGSEEELAAARQGPLLAAVRTAGGPVAMVFVLAPDIWKVDLSVPRFWAGVVGDPTVPLRAVAVVSDSVAVRAATHAFRVSVMMSKRPLAVASMTEEAAAIGWAHEQLAKAG